MAVIHELTVGLCVPSVMRKVDRQLMVPAQTMCGHLDHGVRCIESLEHQLFGSVCCHEAPYTSNVTVRGEKPFTYLLTYLLTCLLAPDSSIDTRGRLTVIDRLELSHRGKVGRCFSHVLARSGNRKQNY